MQSIFLYRLELAYANSIYFYRYFLSIYFYRYFFIDIFLSIELVYANSIFLYRYIFIDIFISICLHCAVCIIFIYTRFLYNRYFHIDINISIHFYRYIFIDYLHLCTRTRVYHYTHPCVSLHAPVCITTLCDGQCPRCVDALPSVYLYYIIFALICQYLFYEYF
jgi:hypothetical protein